MDIKKGNANLVVGLIFFLLASISGRSQEKVLTTEEAVALVLEQNLAIQIADNTTAIAKENSSLLNAGYLPTLDANANANYSNVFKQESEINGSIINVNDLETSNYGAGVNLNYVLFDGMGRRYNFKTFQERYALSALQTQQVIENTLVQLFTVYYQVASFEETLSILEQTLAISKARLFRAERQFEFGQNTKLNVLNAKVDVNTDSINVMNGRQSLENAKRDLNLILNQPLDTPYRVQTAVRFFPLLEMEAFKTASLENNVLLLQAKSALNLSELQEKALLKNYLPTLNLTGSYGWNRSNNGSISFMPFSNAVSGGIGASMRWSLFDGGKRSVLKATAQLDIENQELELERQRLTLEKERKNQWTNYKNALQVLAMQKINVTTTEDNFLRSQKNFELGQITAIAFRQAQLNFISAQISLRQAKYDAKLAELQFLQLVGVLLKTQFL